MKNLTTIIILTAALASGIVSFLYAGSPDTAATTRRRPPMSHLLELSAEQESAIDRADPNFHANGLHTAQNAPGLPTESMVRCRHRSASSARRKSMGL